MAGGDSQERDGRSLRLATPLLPVSQSVHTDSHRLGESRLSQSDNAPQGGGVIPALELAGHQPPAQSSRNRTCELATSEWGGLSR